jgi:hypothetical protein
LLTIPQKKKQEREREREYAERINQSAKLNKSETMCYFIRLRNSIDVIHWNIYIYFVMKAPKAWYSLWKGSMKYQSWTLSFFTWAGKKGRNYHENIVVRGFLVLLWIYFLIICTLNIHIRNNPFDRMRFDNTHL